MHARGKTGAQFFRIDHDDEEKEQNRYFLDNIVEHAQWFELDEQEAIMEAFLCGIVEGVDADHHVAGVAELGLSRINIAQLGDGFACGDCRSKDGHAHVAEQPALATNAAFWSDEGVLGVHHVAGVADLGFSSTDFAQPGDRCALGDRRSEDGHVIVAEQPASATHAAREGAGDVDRVHHGAGVADLGPSANLVVQPGDECAHDDRCSKDGHEHVAEQPVSATIAARESAEDVDGVHHVAGVVVLGLSGTDIAQPGDKLGSSRINVVQPGDECALGVRCSGDGHEHDAKSLEHLFEQRNLALDSLEMFFEKPDALDHFFACAPSRCQFGNEADHNLLEDFILCVQRLKPEFAAESSFTNRVRLHCDYLAALYPENVHAESGDEHLPGKQVRYVL